MDGSKKFAEIPVPALAICAFPGSAQDRSAVLRAVDPSRRAQMEDLLARMNPETAKQIAAFEDGVPSARVVRIANASHEVFRSNESDVLREMNAFLKTLK